MFFRKEIFLIPFKGSLVSLLVFIIFFLLSGFLNASNPSGEVFLLPKPKVIHCFPDSFEVSAVKITGQEFYPGINAWVRDIGLNTDGSPDAFLTVSFIDDIEEARVNEEEAYRLDVKKGEISIQASTEKGVFNALQTFRQLLFYSQGRQWVQACSITDWPAFSIRGFMHDTGRGFIPLEELKKQIGLLSQFKINVFHWHLTEDIAWRLESKVFPELIFEGNFLRLPGKYYTIEEARELVEFCRDHQVLLIPEIDMPGHSQAFTRALGNDMQSEEGMRMLKILLDEICEVFGDLPYIHIGTDEVAFTNPAFVPEMVQYLRAKGKKVISWNPGWSFQAGEIDMVHLWSFRGKLLEHCPAIDSRYHYINHFDTFSDLAGLFHSNIAGVQESNEQVAGAILAAWNDRHLESAEEILKQNNFYPIMLTLAESAWAGGSGEYIAGRGVNIIDQDEKELSLFQDFEERLLHFKETTFSNLPFPYVRQANVKWRITDPFPNQGDLSRVFPPERKLKEQYLFEKKEYSTYPVIGAGIYLRHVWGDLVPAIFQNPEPNHTAYAYTWVYSPEIQSAGLLVGFQNYSRSESDLPPPRGQWDFNQSRIWLNDIEIFPPLWENTHTVRSSEIPLRNENWEARPPVPVSLKKGWNKVLIKLPVGAFSRNEVRLVKWMFTAVFVTPDGKNALDGIVYSPEKKK